MVQTLNILDIGLNGDGIARADDGQTVFVPLTARGDVVQVEIGKDGRGQLVSVTTPSPDRAEPPCRHFGICGGCSLQHINTDTYHHFKRDTVLSVLEKAGVEPPKDMDTIFIPPHTRRRANFAARSVKGKTTIGFHERKSASIRDVPDCLIINEDVRRAMEAFRPYVRDIAGEGNKIDILIQCVEGQTEIALTGKIAPGWEAQQALSDALRATAASRISLRARDYDQYEMLLEDKPYYKNFGPISVNLAPGAFLQPSDEGERALTKCVMDGAGDAARVVDLFCGNGTFTGPLKEGREVVAFDLAADAIVALKSIGVQAHLRNLFKDPLDAEELVSADCVVLDPPRAGAQGQIDRLAQAGVPLIVYVSCNPQTFARDAAMLIQSGHALKKLTIVDQFVWSPHTEVVGVFEKV